MKNERTVYTTRGCFPFILFSSSNRKNANGCNGSYFYFSFFVWGLEKRKRILSYPFSIFYYEIEKRKDGIYTDRSGTTQRLIWMVLDGNNKRNEFQCFQYILQYQYYLRCKLICTISPHENKLMSRNVYTATIRPYKKTQYNVLLSNA